MVEPSRVEEPEPVYGSGTQGITNTVVVKGQPTSTLRGEAFHHFAASDRSLVMGCGWHGLGGLDTETPGHDARSAAG
jgi:hypothetical protein